MALSFDAQIGIISPSTIQTDNDLDMLSKRFEQLNQLEEEKTKFMTELLVRYEYVVQQNQAMLAERNRDREWIFQCLAEKQHYERLASNIQQAVVDNSFVIVLIDGDDMMFLNEFVREGANGGRRAASKLHAAVQNYMQDQSESTRNTTPLGLRIVCRIYANVKGIAEELVRTSVIPDITYFEDFVRGFTTGKTLFDIVDVGMHTDCTNEKIIETFKLYFRDYHCCRLFFGCSYNEGYTRLLEEHSSQEGLRDKVVLVGGPLLDKDLVSLPYKAKRLSGIFRETKYASWGAGPVLGALSPAFVPATNGAETKGSPNSFVTPTGLPFRFPAPVPTRPLSSSSVWESPPPKGAMLSHMARTPSTSTLGSDGLPTQRPISAPMNYAAKAAAPPPPKSKSPTYRPASREEIIARNRAGQRVDPPCKDYDKSEVDRVKKLKLCNIHFLRKECPYGDSCTHLHAYKPTESEIATLRLVARMAPCANGSICQDIKCIYGHRCPAPRHKTNHAKGTKNCIFGDSCKFSGDLHDIDTTIVKTLVIR
ncbi:hypothetical protein GGP41_003660 [Bipolaris sorokiniana]|uniref:C3H1-type domain-containing protein n=1 Tax=Cochliobolus sativus TaxID=45130 RepID=A0A8H5Z9V4_COCSA|nr:hypothetical protein GGP41_003660 [Bipolaris sorokiniana]